MSDERPDALLKSALEKIIYFEARSEQLQNDLVAARSAAERSHAELASAAQREIELRRELAEREVRAHRAHQEREELAHVVDALRSERAELIGKLIEASRIHGSDGPLDDSSFDLASFIAQLRSEVIAQHAPEEAALPLLRAVARPDSTPIFALTASRATSSVSAVQGHAERLRTEGRLQVSARQMEELSQEKVFPGRTEETLFGFSLRELSATDANARIRAAERLRALGNAAAAPALAAALHVEQVPAVQVELLHAFSTVARSEGISVALEHLESEAPEVRIAALKALLALDASRAAPHLSAAMKDPDRAVRRRAALLALSLPEDAALRLGEESIADSDAEVRSLGALALGATNGHRARGLLLDALQDPELKVRRAASQGLSRILGEDLSSIVTLDDSQRRREIRRLATLPARPVTRQAPHAAKVIEVAAPKVVVRSTVALAEVPLSSEPKPWVNEALCADLLGEVRCSIRGRTLTELSAAKPSVAVAEACELLVARGQLVRRGVKYFVA